jgi:hypothetical protein
MMSDMSGKIELTAIANRCSSGACPTIYTTDSIDEGGLETVVVQGFAVSAQRAGVDVPAGELLVEIPRALLEEAVRNLS